MTCNNCIHYEICKKSLKIGNMPENYADKCPSFNNKEKMIPLPFVVGDTVWCVSQKVDNGSITYGEYQVVQARVTSFEIYSWSKKDCNYWMVYKTDKYRYLFDHIYYSFCSEDIGKFVFLTKEAAEAKAKEMEEQKNG